jgi:nitrogen regulatory protein P-II 1
MKRVVAIVRPVMLDDVIYALHKIENFPGATMAEVRGMGRSFSRRVKESRAASAFGFPNQVRIEIVCSLDMLEDIVETIKSAARTGKTGDGKIIISPVEEVVRIRTGERGAHALS